MTECTPGSGLSGFSVISAVVNDNGLSILGDGDSSNGSVLPIAKAVGRKKFYRFIDTH